MASVEKFDVSFAKEDKFLPNRARHGLTWTHSEMRALRSMFAERLDLQAMCNALGRPADGIISKLNQCHAILYQSDTNSYTCNPRFDAEEPMQMKMASSAAYYNTSQALNDDIQVVPDSWKSQQPKPKEPAVAHKNIETKTFIRGRDAKDMSDGEVFSEIASLEAEIARLGAIKAQSKKLAAQITALQADIDALVAYVDAR